MEGEKWLSIGLLTNVAAFPKRFLPRVNFSRGRGDSLTIESPNRISEPRRMFTAEIPRFIAVSFGWKVIEATFPSGDGMRNAGGRREISFGRIPIDTIADTRKRWFGWFDRVGTRDFNDFSGKGRTRAKIAAAVVSDIKSVAFCWKTGLLSGLILMRS